MDQNIFVIVPIGFFLLLGFGIIGWSIYILLRGLPGSAEQWQKDLMSWSILGPNIAPQMLADVKRCRDYLISMSFLAGGIGIVLCMVGWSIIALIATDTSAATTQNNSSFFLASFFASFGIGLGAGAVFAAWHLRNAAKRRVTYADLRQRQLSDYRSSVFRWLAVAMIAWTFGVLMFFSSHVGSTLQIDLFYTVVSVPNTVWGWYIVPGVMFLVLVVIETVLLRIVGFSRLLVTSDATVSQHADDMLRAMVIGLVQYCELLALAQLAVLPFSMLSPRLWASHYWQIGHLPYFSLLSISVFMPGVMQLLGVGILLARGRLGGKFSGWPWQMRQMKQSEGRS